MLTDEELEALLVPFRERMERINAHYIERMGEHVRAIGRLKDSDIQRVRQMRIMDTNIEAIQRELAAASGVNEREAAQLIETAAQRFYEDLDLYGMGKTADTSLMRQLIEAQVETTLGTLHNLSNTTIVADSYKAVVDTAVTAVATDVSDYNSAVRRSLREAARGGVRVRQSDRQVFASGVTRRVDTVVRQNVLDAVNAISNEMSLRGGELFGADGVEISAHALCAEDHLPYQGEQFTNEEFDRLQMDLDRPFGFWNCRHTLYPIVIGVTEPVHTREELEAFREYSTEEIEFEGKTLTRYEWTQEQRKIETEVRYLKDEQIAFKASGDDLGRRQAQDKINAYQEYYRRMSEAAGLRYEDRRMAISGFRRVKSQTEILAAAGGSTGAKKTPGWKDRHAERYYEEVRNRAPFVDANRIANYTVFKPSAIEEIRRHVFIDEHDLGYGEHGRFDVDFEQAQAWQRLTEGKGTETDILLLKHEYVELTQMRLYGYNYWEAHQIANRYHNWERAIKK